MKIALIAAMAKNRVIGSENQLPWHLPADLKHFKSITMGKPIIMGRKTFESIGKALPGRQNIVITRDVNFMAEHVEIVHSFEEALNVAHLADEVMIIGGSSIYQLALPKAHFLYLTLIHHQIDGDAFFPEIDIKEWEQISRQDYSKDEKNRYDYSFVTLKRK